MAISDSKRWDEVQKLFEQALELDASKREVFLKEKCGDDQGLFEEVISLLKADEKQHSIFSASVSDYIPIDDKNLNGKIFGSYQAIKLKTKLDDGKEASLIHHPK